MNFSAWNWATHFRLHEAACLIAGVMPVAKRYPSSEELPPQAKPILVKLMAAYYEWVLQKHNPDRPKSIYLEGCLDIDGMPPKPSLQELSGELVSRESMYRFLSKMEDTGRRSIYDFGSPASAAPNQGSAASEADLNAQDALVRLDKAKMALARRQALLSSPERPGGLAELEALESAVSAAVKEVDAAQHAICVMRGDYLDATPQSHSADEEQKTDFAIGFYTTRLNLKYWSGMNSVPPLDAARLLNNENPQGSSAHTCSTEVQMLARVFEDHSAVHPARRTLLDWVHVAQARKAKHDTTVAETVLALASATKLKNRQSHHLELCLEPGPIEEVLKSKELTAPDTNLSKGTPPKLSDADKAEVVRRYNCGIERSESALGRQFGVSRTTVHKVLVKWGAKKDSPKRSS